MHETQGIVVVLLGCLLVVVLGALQLTAIESAGNFYEMAFPSWTEVPIRLIVIIISILEALWILDRVRLR